MINAALGSVSRLGRLEPGLTVPVADYGATGVSDYDVYGINAAIQYVSNNGGGTVVLAPWVTYYIGASSGNVGVVMASNVRLLGDNSTLLVLPGSEAHGINIQNCLNVAIQGVIVYGTRAGQTLNVHGIRVENTTGLDIAHCHITNTMAYGIGLQEGALIDISIHDTKVSDTGFDGIDFKNKLNLNQNVKLHNIVVRDFDQRAATGKAGIDVRGVIELSNIVIYGQSAVSGAGIRFRNGELIDANGLGGHGSTLTNFHVVGDVVSSATIGVHVVARDVRISNGWIDGYQFGIRLSDINNGVHNTVVSNAVSTAVDMSASSYSTVVGCNIRNGIAYGVDIDTSTGVVLSGNSITSNGSYGVRVQASATDTVLSGNTFASNVTGPVTDAGTGTRASANAGWRTQNRVLSNTFAVDSTGVKSVTIAHGCTGTPTVQACSVVLTRDTNVSDYAVGFVRVVSTTSANVIVEVLVSTASATSGATAKLALSVDMKP